MPVREPGSSKGPRGSEVAQALSSMVRVAHARSTRLSENDKEIVGVGLHWNSFKYNA